MRKLIFIALAICFVIAGCRQVKPALAQDLNISLKQGFVYLWKDNAVKNLTTIETVHTLPVESWGKWNAIIDGWTLDVGAVWDASGINDGAIMLGREFGTLGKYLPLSFPFKDKLKITLYPIGIYIRDIFNQPKLTAASGGAFVKLEVKF